MYVAALKQKDVQSILSWTLEDAVANYDTCKTAIESAAATDGAINDADASALTYLLDVYRYCVGLATTKQVTHSMQSNFTALRMCIIVLFCANANIFCSAEI
jgi:hypothetical protein